VFLTCFFIMFLMGMTYAVLFCLVVRVSSQILGNDKNAVLMHSGIKTQSLSK